MPSPFDPIDGFVFLSNCHVFGFLPADDPRLLAIANEFDTDTGHHLGNFPQAFSHLALIEAAGRIILAERLEEVLG